MTGTRPERADGHEGTETRALLLREAAVGNFGQGGNPDPAILREGRSLSGCKPLLSGKNSRKALTVPGE